MRRFESLRQSRETTGLRSARSRFGRLAIVRRGSRVYGRGRVQIRASTRCQGGGIRGRVGRRVNWGVEARRDRGTDAQRNVLWASVPWSLRAFAHFEQDADSCACGNRRLGLQAGTRRNAEEAEKTGVGIGFEPKGPFWFSPPLGSLRVPVFLRGLRSAFVFLRVQTVHPRSRSPRDPPLPVTGFSTRRRRRKTEGREARLRRERRGSKGAGGDRRRACGFAPEFLNRFSYVAPCALRSGLGRESKTPTPACVGISASRGRDTRQEPEPAS